MTTNDFTSATIGHNFQMIEFSPRDDIFILVRDLGVVPWWPKGTYFDLRVIICNLDVSKYNDNYNYELQDP